MKGGPGASGSVLPPVTGRSRVRVAVSSLAQARVRLATDTFLQTPHRAGALCTGYALFIYFVVHKTLCSLLTVLVVMWCLMSA